MVSGSSVHTPFLLHAGSGYTGFGLKPFYSLFTALFLRVYLLSLFSFNRLFAPFLWLLVPVTLLIGFVLAIVYKMRER